MSNSANTGEAAAASQADRRYVLWILLAVYVLNFLDRQILNILAEPIKRELRLSDSQLGLLTGLAFALFYSLLGLPIARLADRANRVRIIGTSLALWSFFTAACGLAQNYLQLFLLRVGVGIGEAGCSPPAQSLITDYFPREERASALGFYAMGVPIGTMGGLAFGGLIADAFGWRWALVLAGGPGIILALVVMLTLREPRDMLRQQMQAQAEAAIPWREALAELRSKRSFWWAALGASFTALVSYGHTAFFASFFLRNHAEDIQAFAASFSNFSGANIQATGFLGVALGLIIGISGLLGSLIGGRMCDYYGKKDARAFVTLPGIALFLGIPFALAAFLSGNTVLALLMIGPQVFLKSFWYGPIFALAQSVVSPRARATAAAVLLMMFNLVGLGLGPLILGLMSDQFAASFGEADGLRLAMASSAVLGLLGTASFMMARHTIRTDIIA